MNTWINDRYIVTTLLLREQTNIKGYDWGNLSGTVFLKVFDCENERTRLSDRPLYSIYHWILHEIVTTNETTMRPLELLYIYLLTSDRTVHESLIHFTTGKWGREDPFW